MVPRGRKSEVEVPEETRRAEIEREKKGENEVGIDKEMAAGIERGMIGEIETGMIGRRRKTATTRIRHYEIISIPTLLETVQKLLAILHRILDGARIAIQDTVVSPYCLPYLPHPHPLPSPSTTGCEECTQTG